jgi:hypothetical protein
MSGPVSHETVVYDVYDFKVYPLLTDVSGSAPTYGPAVDVPGITEVSTTPNFVTAQLKGDARVMARKGRVDTIKLSATYGKLALDVLKTVLGGTITDVANTSATWSLTGDNSLPYFKAEFQISDVDAGLGDVHCTLYKCNITDGTLLSGKTDDFGQPQMSLEAIPADGTIPADSTTSPATPAKVHPLIDVALLATRTDLDA